MDVVIKEDLRLHQGRVRRTEKDTHRGRRRDGLRGGEGRGRRGSDFVMDRFGYCKTMDRSIYERNQETVDSENVRYFR